MIKYLISGVLITCYTITLHAQAFDEERMDRDLKIAENILTTLSNDNSSRVRLFNGVESNYIPDFGVIFSIPQNTYFYAVSGQNVVYQSGSGSSGSYVIATPPTPEKELAEKEEKEEANEEDQTKIAEEKMKEQMSIFLVDYADLIGQLKPEHKIVVQTRGRNERIYVGRNRKVNKTGEFSAQILKSDLTSYKQGKLNREAALKKITFTTGEDREIAKDVELFATIFSRLYEPDLSNTYYLASRNIGYTQLEGFGITFNLKMYSSNSDQGFHTITTTGEGGLTQGQRNEKVNAMYPEFKETFKINILDYGRTIRSLKPDEMLVFKVKLTECKGCEMPEEIEVIVKGKTLQDYDKGSLSREAGLKQITVKEKRD